MRGGNRSGSGRKKGLPGKKTKERLAIASAAAARGIDPLQVMLENMQHFQKAAVDAEKILKGLTAEDICGRELEPSEQFKVLLAEVKKAAGLRQMAQECARDAAPYIHQRLAAVQHSGSIARPHEEALNELDDGAGTGDTAGTAGQLSEVRH